MFLFAVAKGVQRNAVSRAECTHPGFYSLSRRAYSGTLPTHGRLPGIDFGFYSLSRRAYSGTGGRNDYPLRCRGRRFYSLSRRAYSGTTASPETLVAGVFLFAVAEGVQRNKVKADPRRASDQFLFAVAEGVQRNH